MDNLSNSSPVPNSRFFIETFPLYLSAVFPDMDNICSLFYVPIRQIEIFCPNCKKKQLFNRECYLGEEERLNRDIKYGNIFSLEFSCVEHICKCQKNYYIHVERKNDQIVFTKCGEYPSLSPRVDQAILDVFPDDADLLRKAAICLNEGFGIGAYAYLRQVLESHIYLLLDEIKTTAQEQGDTETVKKLSDLRPNSPMSKNIEVAKDALPFYLRIDGVNPLGLLYKTLSEAIHNKSDKECLDKARDTFFALTFIINTLATVSANRKQYQASLKSLSKKENASAAETEVKNKDDKNDPVSHVQIH